MWGSFLLARFTIYSLATLNTVGYQSKSMEIHATVSFFIRVAPFE